MAPDQELEAAVRRHLGAWFGASEVATWAHLRTYRIPYAQPNQARVLREQLWQDWEEAGQCSQKCTQVRA